MVSNLSLAQDNLLKQLVLIHELCVKHNIEYWIDGGTFLGATRNHKFIPWDDDIDICVLPDDYKKLINVLRKECHKHKNYILYNDVRTFPHWTEYFSTGEVMKNNFYPYNIDIIIVKSLPNDKELIKKDKSIINIALFFYKYHFKNVEDVLNEDKERFLNKGFFLLRRSRFIQYFTTTYLEGKSAKNKDHLYDYIYNDIYVKANRRYYTYDDIFPLKEIEFEGYTFKCPNNTASYLTKLYGKNYLIPPEQKDQLPSSNNIKLNRFSPFFTKGIIKILYLLKEVKNSIKVALAYAKQKKQ